MRVPWQRGRALKSLDRMPIGTVRTTSKSARFAALTVFGHPGAHTPRQETRMIVFGIILLLIAVMNPELAALWGVGIIALFVGLILAVCGAVGRGVGNRRHYY